MRFKRHTIEGDPCNNQNIKRRGDPSALVANMMDNEIIVSDFELYLCYYVYNRTIKLWKGINSVIPLL